MFLHSDLLKLCLKKNTTSLSYSPTPLSFTIRKLALQTMHSLRFLCLEPFFDKRGGNRRGGEEYVLLFYNAL